jgi:hypothetical protein
MLHVSHEYEAVYSMLKAPLLTPRSTSKNILDDTLRAVLVRCREVIRTQLLAITQLSSATWHRHHHIVCQEICDAYQPCIVFSKMILGHDADDADDADDEKTIDLVAIVNDVMYETLRSRNLSSVITHLLMKWRASVIGVYYQPGDTRLANHTSDALLELQGWLSLALKIGHLDICTLPIFRAMTTFDQTFYAQKKMVPEPECLSLPFHLALRAIFDIECAVYAPLNIVSEKTLKNTIRGTILQHLYLTTQQHFPDIVDMCQRLDVEAVSYTRTYVLYNANHPLYAEPPFTASFGQCIMRNCIGVVLRKELLTTPYAQWYAVLARFGQLYTAQDVQADDGILAVLRDSSRLFVGQTLAQTSFVTGWIAYLHARPTTDRPTSCCRALISRLLIDWPHALREALVISRKEVLRCPVLLCVEKSFWTEVVAVWRRRPMPPALKHHMQWLQSSSCGDSKRPQILASHKRFRDDDETLPIVYHAALKAALEPLTTKFAHEMPMRTIVAWDPNFTQITVQGVSCPLIAANILLHILDNGTAGATVEHLARVTSENNSSANDTSIIKWCTRLTEDNVLHCTKNEEGPRQTRYTMRQPSVPTIGLTSDKNDHL